MKSCVKKQTIFQESVLMYLLPDSLSMVIITIRPPLVAWDWIISKSANWM